MEIAEMPKSLAVVNNQLVVITSLDVLAKVTRNIYFRVSKYIIKKMVLIIISYISLKIPEILIKKQIIRVRKDWKKEKVGFLSISRLVYIYVYCFQFKTPQHNNSYFNKNLFFILKVGNRQLIFSNCSWIAVQ